MVYYHNKRRRGRTFVGVRVIRIIVFLVMVTCLLMIVSNLREKVKDGVNSYSKHPPAPTNLEVWIDDTPDVNYPPHKPTVEKLDAWKDYPE